MEGSSRDCDRSGGYEEKLLKDFLFYVAHTKWALTKLPENLRKQAKKWLKYLIGHDARTLGAKKLRNLHLSSLLLQMTFGELTGIYAENTTPKPNEPLPQHPSNFISEETQSEVPKLDGTFQIPSWVQSIIDGEESAAGDAEEPRVTHVSNDGRVYLATKAHPKYPGAMGYLSISVEKENGGSAEEGVLGKLWCGGDEGGNLERTNESSVNNQGSQCASCTRSNQTSASRILAGRRPPEAREKLGWMHDNLVSKVERAMKGETIVPVEIILDKMLEDAMMDPELADLPPQAQRDELLRRLLDAVVLKKRKVARREEFLNRMEERVLPSYSGDPCSKKPDCMCGPGMSTASQYSRPDMNRRASRPFCDEASQIDQVLARAKEDLEAEANAEFNQILESIRDDITLDLNGAAAEHRRAKKALETSLEARDKLRQATADSRGIEKLTSDLKKLRARRECYSQAIAQEERKLCEIKTQADDIIVFRQGEIDDLQRELCANQRKIVEVIKQQGNCPDRCQE